MVHAAYCIPHGGSEKEKERQVHTHTHTQEVSVLIAVSDCGVIKCKRQSGLSQWLKSYRSERSVAGVEGRMIGKVPECT